MNYGFVIDARKCIGCHACSVACKSENQVPLGVNRTWVKYIEKGSFPDTRRYFTVMRCNHCEEPPCVAICPVEALHKRDDGIVDFDARRCIGCKACGQACPYSALYVDPETSTSAKCNYCAHRKESGLNPACTVICPQQAIISGDLDDPNGKISKLIASEQVVVRRPEKGTRPKVFYINGDGAALDPLQAPESGTYMWSAQARGVGHFAKDAVKGDGSHGVPVRPASAALGNPGAPGKPKRVYDVPSKGAVWGWEVPAYVWAKAISAGSFLLLSAYSLLSGVSLSSGMQWGLWAMSLFFLAATGALLVKDLDRPDRFSSVMLRPQFKSWLVKGGLTITGYGAFLVVWAGGRFLQLPLVEAIGLWGGAAFALLTSIYTAFLFGAAKGRDFWQSPMMTLHMLVNSIIAGGSAMALLAVVLPFDSSAVSLLKIILGVSFGLHLIILATELFGQHPSRYAERAAETIRAGALKNEFWSRSVLVGNLLPLMLVLLPVGVPLLAIAGILALVGVYYTEKVWIKAPQTISLS